MVMPTTEILNEQGRVQYYFNSKTFLCSSDSCEITINKIIQKTQLVLSTEAYEIV